MAIATENIAGLILAGGTGQRMQPGGVDKCLLTVNGKTLLQHCQPRLAPQVASVALNVNGRLDRFSAALDALPLMPMLPDSPPSLGPLSGVLAGLTWLQSQPQQWLLTVAADTPFFPTDLATRLSQGLGLKSTLAVASEQGRMHPLFGLWHQSLLPALQLAARRDQRRMQWLVGQLGGIQVEFSGATPAFFNINTPADLIQAERLCP